MSPTRAAPQVAIIGAGWAGLAAAVAATQAGMRVSLYEAAREPGGRARNVPVKVRSGAALAQGLSLDNGQHILIGAYRASLDLMRTVGADPSACLQRVPLDLRDAAGNGLALPDWPAALQPLAGAWAIMSARGWRWQTRWALLRALRQWQRQGFQAPSSMTVTQLCQQLPEELVQQWVDPLCVAALNTPIEQASAQVFLRVLQDSLAGAPGSADMLLPAKPLGDVLAQPAWQWLQQRGAQLVLGQRIDRLEPVAPERVGGSAAAWQLQGQCFDAVLLACPAWEAVRLLSRLAQAEGGALVGAAASQPVSVDLPQAASIEAWLSRAQQLEYEAIGTVFLQSLQPADQPPLPKAMLAVGDGPAQFVFDRQRLTGDAGVTAWVASTMAGDKAALSQAVLQQAERLQARLQAQGAGSTSAGFEHVATIVEKRATFRCIAGVQRPAMAIDAAWPTLLACGDYIDGPYPATLEAAVLSGQEAVLQLQQVFTKAAQQG
ncbi:FAD-binding protein [Lampropedia aestuarii]|uniref:FAD-binding protein n=1 Tax=Lampropedia aestuarii TaxID=2562762 RepID=A0A4S5BXS2_9BURK|nr:hydroxysqualene dehydroxylase HpnE [Lampropedia aestuarii]THJ34868.1 FAD-binding protein [Lampropedia aestuarii]